MRQVSAPRRSAVRAHSVWSLVAVAGGVLPVTAFGCSFPPGYESAQPPRINAAQTELLPGPRIYLESISRGFSSGNFDTCSDSGSITLIIDPRDVSPTDLYAFEVADGAFPDAVLPEGYVEPVELASGETGFSFHWLDLPPGAQELQPIDAMVRINRISWAGELSTPMLLRIESPGGAPVRATQAWNSIVMWIGVAIVLLALVSFRSNAFKRSSGSKAELAAIQARLRELAEEKKRRD